MEMKGPSNEAATRNLFELVSEENGIVSESIDRSENILEAMVVHHDNLSGAENFSSVLEENTEDDEEQDIQAADGP